MKLRDLFVDYYEVEGVRIVRVLNLNVFFALRNSEKDADTIQACYVGKREAEELKNNKLLVKKLYKRAWDDLEKWERLYSESFLEEAVEDARKRGFFEKKNDQEIEKKSNKDFENKNRRGFLGRLINRDRGGEDR